MCEGSIVSANDTRPELFDALRALSEVVQEMRAGQLVAAIGELCADHHGRGLWDASDAELLEAVWQFQREQILFREAEQPPFGVWLRSWLPRR